MVRRFSARVLLLAGIAGALFASGEATAAGAPVALPISSFGAIVVDQPSGHVLITSPADNEVLVRNVDGSADAAITGVDDAGAVKIDPSDTYAYVVESSASAVAQIDLDTLTVTQTFPLGSAAACPVDLTFASGLIWITYDHSACTGGDSASGLASLDPTDGSVHAYQLTTAYYGQVVASPDGKTLYTGQMLSSPGQGLRYDITDPTNPTQSARFAAMGPHGVCDSLEEMAISADGQDIYFACGAPYEFLTVPTSDLSEGDAYPASAYPAAVAATTDGGYIAGATTDGTHTAWVFKRGQTTPAIATFDLFRAMYSSVPSGGIAISGDGSDLYVITDDSHSSFELSVVATPTVAQPSFDVAAGQTAIGPGTAAHVNGTIRFTDFSNASGLILHVSRENPDASVTPLPDVVTGEGGVFTITDTPPAVPGTYTYTIAYDGDRAHTSGQAQVTVTVVLPTPALTLHESRPTITTGGKVTLLVHIQHQGGLGAVTLISTLWNGAETSRPIAFDNQGNATAVVSPQVHTRYHVTFAGDDAYAAAVSNYVGVSVHAHETGVMSGFYATRTHYHLYHFRAACESRAHTHCPVFATGVKPASAGVVVRFRVQELRAGAWRPVLYVKARLNTHSAAGLVIFYNSARVEGIRVRIRGEFPHTLANLAATSAWQYFRVTS